jgi:hypothetical protein
MPSFEVQWMKVFFFRFLTTVIIVIFLLVIVELGLRLFWNGRPKLPAIPPNPRYFEDADPDISYTLIPNHKYSKGIIKTNKYGFRNDPAITEKKKPGVFRIILLGDSIVFGVRLQPDKTIGAVLRKRFSEIDIPGVTEFEVINLGMPGHNINQYAAVLDKYGMRYSPDLIIAGITISNDLEGRQARYLGNGHLYLEPTASFEGVNSNHKLPPRIIRASYIWRYLYFRRLEPKRQELKRQLTLAAGKVPPRLLYASMNGEDEVWENVDKGFARIDAAAKKTGAKLIYTLFPAVEQIYYADIGDAPQRMIKNILKKYDADVLDFYGIFQDIYRITAILPFNDLVSHPSAKSNEIVASTIRDSFARKNGTGLKEEFSGSVKLGFSNDASCLSYGWGQRRKMSDIRFRNIQGASARIVFGRKSGRYSRIEIVSAVKNECIPQIVVVYLNSENVGSYQIKTSDVFEKYSIELKKTFYPNSFNTLDLQVTNPCHDKGSRLLAKYDRLDMVSVSQIQFK